MKTFLRISCILLVILFMQPICAKRGFAQQGPKNITILFTHDMHDHLLPNRIQIDGNIAQRGGYARLFTAINEERQKNPDSILVDAGDFSMGTLFQSIYVSDAPEIRTMGKIGYDVVTFGNHEYDYRAEGLADSLNAAKNSGDRLPKIVQSNVSFPKDKNGKMSDSLAKMKQAMDNYGVKDYTIINRGGLKIGVFGLMGKDAASNAPMSGVKFTDVVENAKGIVNKLKSEEKVDIIVCLSHSGTSNLKAKSEDEILAKKVQGIDVIISGHTHTTLTQPIVSGKTIIASCGEYCENLGVMNISQGLNKGWKVDSYRIKAIDNNLSDDPNIAYVINGYKKIVQEKYLNNFGMNFDEVLANSTFNFVASLEVGIKHAEDTLGNFISDAYIYAVEKAEGAAYDPISVAIVPSGTIRGSFVKGNITVADAFTVSSLGIGEDKIAGYPLISAYLTGKELKTVCEVDASIAKVMPAAQLYMSGMSFTFNPKRLIFNKVTNVALQNLDGSIKEIDDSKLYRVVAGLYSAQMLSVVGQKSHGLLSIVPKNKYGKAITDFESYIIKDKTSGRNNEVKEWLAIAEYLKSFKKVDGVPLIPEYYSKVQGRKIVDNNGNILELIKSPNAIAYAIYAFSIAIIMILVLLIKMLIKRFSLVFKAIKKDKENYV